MPDRQALDVNFNVAQAAGIQSAQVGNKPLDLNANVATAAYAPRDNALVNSLLNSVMQLGNKAIHTEVDKSAEEAYLKGQQAVGVVKTEEELESDPLTRGWMVQGFRDTSARLALIDASTSINSQMNDLRTKSPEEFGNALAERRQQIISKLEGTSLATRKAIVGQMALSDRAAMDTYKKARAEYIAQTDFNTIRAGVNSSLTELNNSKDNVEAYKSNAAALYGQILTTVVHNQRFDNIPEVRQKLLFEALHSALESDNPSIFLLAQGRKDGIDAAGKPATLFDTLSDEQRTKLMSAYRSGKERYDVLQMNEFAGVVGAMQAQINTDVSKVESQDVETMLRKGAQIGYYKSPKDMASVWENFWVQKSKQVNRAQLGQMWLAGDQNGMIALPGQPTDSEGADAAVTFMVKQGANVPQIVATLANTARNKGSPAALKKIAELTGPSISQVANLDNITPQAKEIAKSYVDQLSYYKSVGDKSSQALLLSALPQDAQDFMVILDGHMEQNGGNLEVALAKARKDMQPESMYVKGDKAAYLANMTKERQNRVSKIAPEGLFAQAGTGIGKLINMLSLGTLSKDSPQYSQLNVDKYWFANDSVLNAKQAAARERFSEEFGKLVRLNRNLTPDAAEQLALARTVAAQINTGDKSGPLLIDSSIPDIKQYFGIKDPNVANDLIGQAVAKMAPAPEGKTVTYSTNSTGKLMAEYWDKDGRAAGGAVLNPKDVGNYVQSLLSARVNNTKELYGPGVTADLKDASGEKVSYNGNNTAMVPNDLMLEYRKQLVKLEGVRYEPYQNQITLTDGSTKTDKKTIGIGFTQGYYIEPDATGKVSAKQVSQMFAKASDDAARAGADAQAFTGNKSKQAFMLMSLAAYQGGTNFGGTSYGKQFLEVFKKATAEKTPDNVALAAAAFRKTPMYTHSPAERRALYMDLINQALR